MDWVRKNIWDTPSLLPDLYDFGFSYANMATDFAKRTANFPDLTSLTDLW